ncbi:unnamed protein product, partial [Mesorhabditis belari]|uniref:Uncharacterized protein n=1 Tax=Mesorhabditis belari TaxID=2138241 RepID=A0AAF3EH15_9BILA
MFTSCLMTNNLYCVQIDALNSGYPFSFFKINTYLSSLTLALQKGTVFFQLALSFNRFFAIFYQSQYYHVTERLLPLQVCLFFGIPLVLYGGMQTGVKIWNDQGTTRYTFGGPLYDPRMGAFTVFYVRNREWRQHLKASLEYASAAVDIIILFLDLTIFKKVTEQQKQKVFHANGIERRLLKQVSTEFVII